MYHSYVYFARVISLTFAFPFLFFCSDTATTEIYTYLHTLSLPDALPICYCPKVRCHHPRRVGRPSPFSVSSAPTPAGSFAGSGRSEEHTSELQSLMRISYAVFCLKKKKR